MIAATILMSLGLLMAGLAVPLILGKVRRNEAYGFRTTLTLSSDEIWFPANRFAGKWLAGWGVGSFLTGLSALFFTPLPRLAELALLALPLTVVIPCIVSTKWTNRRFGS